MPAKKSSEKKPIVDIDDVSDDRIIAAISYLGVLCLIPLLLKKDDKLAMHHGRQGLILLIGWVAIWFASFVPVLGWLVAFFVGIAFVVLMVIGIIKALAGEMWEMPVLGKYAKQLNL